MKMRFIFRLHAVQRMFERGIAETDVVQAVLTGETIEDYPSDWPYPSRLVLGWIDDRPLHIVVAENIDAGEIIVVTAYQPESTQWSPDFRRRQS